MAHPSKAGMTNCMSLARVATTHAGGPVALAAAREEPLRFGTRMDGDDEPDEGILEPTATPDSAAAAGAGASHDDGGNATNLGITAATLRDTKGADVAGAPSVDVPMADAGATSTGCTFIIPDPANGGEQG
jgi:hypothetical protein